MDKAEFLRLTNETRGQPTRWADFEHLIPGWGNKVAYPYNLPIEEGIRAEMERLRGSRYLVAVLHREYDYDGLFEQLFFDEAFLDPMEAMATPSRSRRATWSAPWPSPTIGAQIGIQ